MEFEVTVKLTTYAGDQGEAGGNQDPKALYVVEVNAKRKAAK